MVKINAYIYTCFNLISFLFLRKLLVNEIFFEEFLEGLGYCLYEILEAEILHGCNFFAEFFEIQKKNEYPLIKKKFNLSIKQI